MLIAICDNDLTSLEVLRDYSKKLKQINKISAYHEPEGLLEDIRKGAAFDLIFMDIDLGLSYDGIDVASKIYEWCPTTQTIFVTGYNDRFSQRIFLKPVNLCGYLVKPFQMELFKSMVEKAVTNRGKKKEEMFWFKNKGQKQSIPIRYICFFESQGHKIYIASQDEVICCYDKLEFMKEKLPENFVQCHKSYIVNLDYVKRIEQKQIYLACGKTIPVSRSKYLDTREMYFRYIGNRM